MSMTTELAQTKELAFLMSERFTMNPISCKHLNEAWREAFPDEVAVAKRMLALVEALEAKDKRNTELEDLLEAEIKSWMQRYDSANNRREAAEKRIAELEQKADIYDMLREDYEIKGSLVDFVDWQSKRIAELEARDIQPLGVQLITEAIGAHAYIVGCLQQNRPDLALEESLKWVQGISQAAVMATEGE